MADYAILYSDQNAMLEFDGTMSFDFHNASNITTNPVETPNGFIGINKVDSPSQIKLTVAYRANQQAFNEKLFELQELQRSTQLFDIVTPQYYFRNYTIESLDFYYSQTHRINTVDLVFTEIRQANSTITTSEYAIEAVKTPDSTATVKTGKTQEQEPTVDDRSRAAAIFDIFAGGE